MWLSSEQAGGLQRRLCKSKRKKNTRGCDATSGPGGMNFVTSAGNCYYDSVPAIFITGQVTPNYEPDESIRQIGFQEADMCSIFKSITNIQS